MALSSIFEARRLGKAYKNREKVLIQSEIRVWAGLIARIGFVEM